MNDSYLLVLLAIGTGISLGWILRSYHAKLNPDGIVKLSESMAKINEGIRNDAKALVKEAEDRAEQYRLLAYNDATFWREHAQDLVRFSATKPMPVRPPTPPPVVRNGGMNGHLDENQKKLFEMLVSKGMTPEVATSIARGETDGLPPDPVLDEIAAVTAQDDSGAV